MFNWASLTDPNQAAYATSPRPAAPRLSRDAMARMAKINARFDNATTTDENRRSWWAADMLSAKSANNFMVRRNLRMRSRYETSNNPYLFGIANSNADDLIATGPTLQVRTASERYNNRVEKAWREWCEEVDLAEKLRTLKLAKTVDGEGFLILKNCPSLEHPVKLYPVDIEADQVTSPAPSNLSELWIDGLTLDPITQRPTSYHVLKSHPGDFFFPSLNPMEVEKVNARNVLHWFHKFRPGQVRGVPVFTSSLDVFVELRDFRKAVLTSARTVSKLTAFMETDGPAAGEDDDDPDNEEEAFERLPIDNGMLTTLPRGTKVNFPDPKQPATTYEMFQQACLGEACRPLSYPLNLALGTSQKFNFSSAKLDHINYRNALTIERAQCNRLILAKLFREWYVEAVLCGAIPAYNALELPPLEWHWPGFESLDPLVDAQAAAAMLSGGLDTFQAYWARRGRDWKVMFAQMAEELKEQQTLGLVFGEPVTQTVSQTSTDDQDEKALAATFGSFWRTNKRFRRLAEQATAA